MSDGYGRSAPNPLSREQTINLIVKTCLDHEVTDQRQIAYTLATAQHESTNFTKPEEEFGRDQAVVKKGYQGGENYYGRGYAHVTHLENYQKVGRKIGMGDELADNPALAADPEIAARVMVLGMRDGDFSKKRLADYLGPNAADYEGARWIINGIDRKAQVAALARNWEPQVPELVARVQRDGVDLTRTTPPPAPDASLQRGDANARVFALQQYLKALDVTNAAGQPLKPDGDFGASTEQAIRRYQDGVGIDPTGTVDRALLKRLQTDVQQAAPDFKLKSYTDLYGPLSDGVLKPGDRGDPVYQLRLQLAGLGHLAEAGSKFNSKYDTATRNAVKNFQQSMDIEPDNGWADKRTRDAINARAVARGLPEANYTHTALPPPDPLQASAPAARTPDATTRAQPADDPSLEQFFAAARAGDEQGMRAASIAYATPERWQQAHANAEQQILAKQQQLPGRDNPLFAQALTHLEQLGPQAGGYLDRVQMEGIAGAVAHQAKLHRLPGIDALMPTRDGQSLLATWTHPNNPTLAERTLIDINQAARQPLEQSLQQLVLETQRQQDQAVLLAEQRQMEMQQPKLSR